MTETRAKVIKVLQKVERMRAEQKSFFKTKRKAALIRSKQLEKEVDTQVSDLLNELEQYKLEL